MFCITYVIFHAFALLIIIIIIILTINVQFNEYTVLIDLGGASKEETDSGLFVYSTIPFMNIQIKDKNVTFDNKNNDNNNENINDNNDNKDNENSNNDDNRTKKTKLLSDQIIFKESWNFKKNCFEWKNNENLISNPRIISQVSTVHMCTFVFRIIRKII